MSRLNRNGRHARFTRQIADIQDVYMAIEIKSEGMLIDAKPFPLICGSVQSWRLDPDKWAEILDKVQGLGFDCIEVYVPWGVHEQADGSHDFSGSRDIGSFLDLAHQRGLKVIVRPGPHANAEITGFGYPDRVLRNPELLARGPEGNPVWVPTPPRMFPSVTYAGQKLYQEYAGYLDALASILRERLYPDGPVIALQADNEMTFFFRTGAFDCDYSDAALEEYTDFLEEKYNDIQTLNKAYRRQFGHFNEVEPPTRFQATNIKELPWYLDWTEFKELLMRRAVVKVADLFRARDLGSVPITHNYPLGHLRSPLDLPGLEQEVDLTGMDMYYRREDYETLKSRCLALCGASRFPWAPEFGCGGYHAWPPLDQDDMRFTTLAACMHGLRGINFYMTVDRERWYGAPIRRDGSEDPERADLVRRIVTLLRAREGSHRHADVLLCTSRLYGRLENLANVFDPLSPMALGALGLDAVSWCQEIDLGLKRSPASSHAAIQDALFQALNRSRAGFDLGEAGRPSKNLSRYRMCVMPTLEILEHQTAVDLLDFAIDGGLLVIGPDVPRFDQAGRSDTTFRDALSGKGERVPRLTHARRYELGKGSVILLPQLSEQLDDPDVLAWSMTLFGRMAGCETLPDPADPGIDVAVHRGTRDFIWLANPSDQERFAAITRGETGHLTDRWTGEVFKGQRIFSIPMPPFSVRPLEVAR
jgi:beta-galactosidase